MRTFAMESRKERLKLAIKNELLGRLTVGEDKEKGKLSADWLYGEYLPSLSEKEEQALEEILVDLVAEGIIEQVQGRRPTYRLTSKGKELFPLG